MPLTDALELYSRIDNLLGADYTVVAGYNSFGRNATMGVRAKF
jgi:outer membrane cobalamin receptor